MLLAVVASLSGAVAACGSDGNSSGGSASGAASGSGSGSTAEEAEKFASKDATTVVQVEATEYLYKPNLPEAKGPKVYFTVKNTGKEDHEFEILGPDGKAVDEIAAFGPGLTKNLAVELAPATYTIQCILEKDGKTHASLGMTMKYTVT